MKLHKRLSSLAISAVLAATNVFFGTSVIASAEDTDCKKILPAGDSAVYQCINIPSPTGDDNDAAVYEGRFNAADSGKYTAFLNQCMDFQWGYQDLLNRSNGKARQAFYNEMLEIAINSWNSTEDLSTVNVGYNEYPLAIKASYKNRGLSDEEADDTLFAFLNDNPWVYFTSQTYAKDGYDLYVLAEKEYLTSAARMTAQDQIVKYVQDTCAKASGETSSYKKTMIIHDEIVDRMDYVMTGKRSDNTIMGCVTEKKGVCDCYAMIFRLLMSYAGEDCIYLTGKGDGVNHAWNMVRMDDDQFYWFDVTWDDPIWGGIPSEDEIMRAKREYFAKGNTNFNTSHIRATSGQRVYKELPPVPDNDYVYYAPPADEECKKFTETHSMTLRDNIGVNNFVKFEKNATRPVMTAWIDGAERVECDGELQEDGTYKFTYHASIPEMADTIHYTYTASFSGKRVTTDECEYSVRDYCEYWFQQPSTDADLKDLLAKMLNCGAYSQIMFDHNTADLANSILPKYGYSTDLDSTAIDQSVKLEKNKEDSSNYAGSINSASLVFNSNISLKFYFTLDKTQLRSGDRVYFGYRKKGSEAGFNTIGYSADGDRYYATIDNIFVQNLKDTYECVILIRRNASYYLGSSFLYYSPECYAASKFSSSDTKLKNTVCSLMMYCNAAKKYFTKAA